MADKARISIVGYGNVGKGTHFAILNVSKKSVCFS